MPWQVVSSPVNPCLQAQLKEPSLLVQFAFSLHGLVSAKHLSISKEIKAPSLMTTKQQSNVKHLVLNKQ